MSTSLKAARPAGALPKIPKYARVAIVTAQWNGHITSVLTNGAVRVLEKQKVRYACYQVPGAVELTYAASRLMAAYSAVIVIGCVIKGDTPHFDYVCRSVTDGVTHLNTLADVPVIFGVLTVNDEAQAMDRAGGRLGNKGAEAAEAAIRMIAFNNAFENEFDNSDDDSDDDFDDDDDDFDLDFDLDDDDDFDDDEAGPWRR